MLAVNYLPTPSTPSAHTGSMSTSALPSVSPHGAVERGQEPSSVGRSELLTLTPFSPLLYVSPSCPPRVLQCVLAAELPSFVLLRELPEGGGAVKAVVVLALSEKDRLARASQMTCDSYDLFSIISSCASLFIHPHAPFPRLFLTHLIWVFTFLPCVCVSAQCATSF